MSFSIRLMKTKKNYLKLCEFSWLSLSEAFKTALLEKIEDEYDIALAEQAHYEYLKDNETISHEDFMKELGL